MALIIDPDNLTDSVSDDASTNVFINTSAKTIQLNSGVDGLSADGVTLKCLYSFLKEEWKDDPNSKNLAAFPFPMVPITDEQYELVEGWDFVADSSRYLIRTGGWAVKNNNGVSLEEWAGIVSLGSIGTGDQAYFQQVSGGSAVDFQLAGPINQAIKVYGDATHGDFDRRGYLKIFCRIYQKTFALTQLSDIGVTAMTYQVYRFPLANAADSKIKHKDTVVSTEAPYSGMSITWYESAQQRSIGGTNRNFHIIIDGNGGSAEQIYEFVQYQLRQAADIDDGSGTQTGKITADMLRFVGDTLYTSLLSEGGVFIDDYAATDVNRLVFMDDTGTQRTFPYTAALAINFGDNLKNDASAKYWVFFTNDDAGDNLGYDYGTANAIIVDDATGADMAGLVSGNTSITKTFAYDANVQRGSDSAGDDAPITAVAIGLSTGQFVKAAGTITRSIANTVSLVASLERNYSNPA